MIPSCLLPTNHLRPHFLLPVITVVVVHIFLELDFGFILLSKGNFYFKHSVIYSMLTQPDAQLTPAYVWLDVKKQHCVPCHTEGSFSYRPFVDISSLYVK